MQKPRQTSSGNAFLKCNRKLNTIKIQKKWAESKAFNKATTQPLF